MHLKTSAEAGGATKKTEKKRMYANFNMAAFLTLTLDFRKADMVETTSKNYLRVRVFHISLPSLGIFSSIMENTYPVPRKGNEGRFIWFSFDHPLITRGDRCPIFFCNNAS